MSIISLVSIVAVCHNHSKYVLETLNSIRGQTYPEIELIIINNLRDECEDIIRKWIEAEKVDCVFIQNEKPLSVTANFNIGLEISTGKYFQGISCDDIMLSSKIEKQVHLYNTLDDNYVCVYGDMIIIDEEGKEISGSTVLDSKVRKWGLKKFPVGNLSYELSLLSFIPAPSVLIKTETLKKLGGYDEKYIIEDWPTWIMFSKGGFKFAAIEDVVVKYRVLVNSMDHSRSLEYFKTLISIYYDNKDFFDFKNKEIIRALYNLILSSKEKSYFFSLKQYSKFLFVIKFFSLRQFLKLIRL
jgi:glycosyltransferase involved in cell wall biosynthesis